MESHSSSPRRVEKPLRQTLLQAPFDRMAFEVSRYMIKEPNGNIIRDVLDFTQLGEPVIPICYRVLAYDDTEYSKAVSLPSSRAVIPPIAQMYRKHKIFQTAGFVSVSEDPDDDGEMEYRVKDFTAAAATWTIDPLDDYGPGARCYKHGYVEFKVKRMAVSVEKFVSVKSAGPQLQGRICIPRLKAEGGGIETYDIEVSKPSHDIMVMEAKTPNNAIGLKFTLALADSEGSLEVWSRGLDYTLGGYTYLRELVFAMWLVFCEENQVCFEKW